MAWSKPSASADDHCLKQEIQTNLQNEDNEKLTEWAHAVFFHTLEAMAQGVSDSQRYQVILRERKI